MKHIVDIYYRIQPAVASGTYMSRYIGSIGDNSAILCNLFLWGGIIPIVQQNTFNLQMSINTKCRIGLT